MKQTNQFFNANEKAVICRIEYCQVVNLIQRDKNLCANLLEAYSSPKWYTQLNRKLGHLFNRPVILIKSSNCLIVSGEIGRNSCISYEIRGLEEQQIKITPIAFIPARLKIITSARLALLFGFPILLSPLFYKMYQATALRNSKIYLPAFCRYLKSNISTV